ncbi:D-galactarate dehydratase [Symmachiella macrocystis]|uniref:D-galactarate dehydratase n=1 Tax=Symmachiella macrocystis TaxID=2527985 RepID=A0A5C6BSE6_9PLAN|nr:altronate dehydratase family protein [Symmachiella macrocystis]TWU14707.1 D-galactarate dehydratase [Symmachiella macrocystis]
MSAVTTNPFISLHADDNIAVAARHVPAGTTLEIAGNGLTTNDAIDLGHKVAVIAIAKGQPVKKFGQTIGFASRDIPAGTWVHTHNVVIGELELDYACASDIPPDPAPITGRAFMGYRRPDGRAATRNYVGIISTVNCSASTSKYAAAQFDHELLEQYENIDGIIPLVHKAGCAMQYGGDDHYQLNRVLSGFAKHPNIGAYVIVGLGCETGPGSFLAEKTGLVQLQVPGQQPEELPLILNIQDVGGVRKTVQRTVEVLKELLPEANKVRREPIPVSELILGCECGGSDGNSGVTANPALGIASDLLIANGGTSILAETPEICGGEHTLTRRAATKEVGEKLIERVRWWEEYTAKFGVEINNNPSPGNKKGGLTTIYEKSLGAIAKGGGTALKAVYQYAEPVTEKGFVFMDSPGYDPASVTGMVAGGANVVVFTTGRGSCFGCKPVPSIKVATNTPMYERMVDDMDINAGKVLDGSTVEDVGAEIFEMIVATASGEQTKSEAQGIGDEEFCPWSIGPVL